MYKIQLNASGTRFLDVDERHLATIERFGLFRDLIASNGYVDEDTLDVVPDRARLAAVARNYFF